MLPEMAPFFTVPHGGSSGRQASSKTTGFVVVVGEMSLHAILFCRL